MNYLRDKFIVVHHHNYIKKFIGHISGVLSFSFFHVLLYVLHLLRISRVQNRVIVFSQDFVCICRLLCFNSTVTILSFQTDMPGQTVQTQIGVYTVCHSVCIVWTHYCVVEPHRSNFRVITTIFFGVRIFRKFTVSLISFNTSGSVRMYSRPFCLEFPCGRGPWGEMPWYSVTAENRLFCNVSGRSSNQEVLLL